MKGKGKVRFVRGNRQREVEKGQLTKRSSKKRRYWEAGNDIGQRSKGVGGNWQNVCLDCLLVDAANKGRGNGELPKKSVVTTG